VAELALPRRGFHRINEPGSLPSSVKIGIGSFTSHFPSFLDRNSITRIKDQFFTVFFRSQDHTGEFLNFNREVESTSEQSLMKRQIHFAFLIVALLILAWPTAVIAADQTSTSGPMRIAIDVRELPRKLIEAELVIPIKANKDAQEIALWYPKWVPGSHGPGGPIANIAGLQIRDSAGDLLMWKRTPGEVYRMEVAVPGDVNQLHISVRYIADQPTTTSFGHDCFGSRNIGMVSPGSLLFYQEGVNIDEQQITTELHLPKTWQAATALPAAETDTESTVAENIQGYETVSLRTLVDSPIMFGRYYQSFELAEDNKLAPPHTLHVFADDQATTNLNSTVVDKYRSMVSQTARLIGSHPFDRFDILLGVTDALPKNGLEHLRSTFNVLPPASLRSAEALKGWDRLLVPHEYLHSWCGKYRRPAGMLTTDFHTPKDTELLWVYEGLTQYLGELVEARSGMMSADEFRHRLLVELRNATHQQGRQWRTLADTAAASHILRAASPSWSGLRRSQDYYMEGMLFWLEADAHIRHVTNNKKSLDDFCQSFFKAPRSTTLPVSFNRDEVVKQLNSVAKFDWDGLISRRVESFQQQFDPAVADRLGYKFQLTATKPSIPAATFRHSRGIDLLDSLGIAVATDGKVRRVLLGTPADQARLAPTVEIIGVGNHKWSGKRLLDAVEKSSDRTPIELLITSGDEIRTLQLHYFDGLRYWNLNRDETKPDLLADILKAKSGS
jgi:predicted metalloprotease with PDZ domain